MKQTFYIILAFFILIGCKSKQKENTHEKQEIIKETDNSHVQVALKNQSIVIKDSTHYSISFLKKFKESKVENALFTDSLLILDNRDTISFPSEPKTGKRTVLTARKGNLAIALTIKRVNYTTIDYRIEMVEFGKSSFNSNGQADLSPNFYFGSETDESRLSDLSYLVTQFSDTKDSCFTYIRIGKEKNSSSYLLGEIIKNCNGELRDISLKDSPTLMEK